MFFFSNFIAIFIQFLSFNSTENNVEIVISNIRNNKGQIAIGIFKDQSSFEKEKPYLNKKFEKKRNQNGEMTIRFEVPPGVYGFTLLDDENSDSKMEYNFFGMPLEGFGFSNYYHTGFTRPKFDAFKLEIKKEDWNKCKIKVRYI